MAVKFSPWVPEMCQCSSQFHQKAAAPLPEVGNLDHGPVQLAEPNELDTSGLVHKSCGLPTSY